MNGLRYICALALLLVLSSVALPAQSYGKKPAKNAGSNLQATLEKLERDGWEAFKNKDDKAYTALCAPDYTGVFADGQPPHDLKSALQAMHGMTVNNYQLSDLKVTALGPDAALVTYTATPNITAGGKTQDYKLAVTDAWVKQAGSWKAIRYHESEVK